MTSTSSRQSPIPWGQASSIHNEPPSSHHPPTIPNSPGPHPRPPSFPLTRVRPSWPATTPRPVARPMRELVPAPAKSSRDAESSLTLGTTTREASNHQQCGDEKPCRSAGILAGLAPSTKLSADHMAQLANPAHPRTRLVWKGRDARAA